MNTNNINNNSLQQFQNYSNSLIGNMGTGSLSGGTNSFVGNSGLQMFNGTANTGYDSTFNFGNMFRNAGLNSTTNGNNNPLGSLGSMFSGNSNGGGDIMGMALAADTMGGNIAKLVANGKESKVGNIISAIPGLSTIGGVVNTLFGSKLNNDFINATEARAKALRNFTSNATTNDSLLADFANNAIMTNVSKSEVGKDGWFSHKARRKTNALNTMIEGANSDYFNSILHTADNVDSLNDVRVMTNYMANGGSLNHVLASGGDVWKAGVNIAKDIIKRNEGWRSATYKDHLGNSTIGYGFTNAGFRERYKDGITNSYPHGMSKQQAEQELDWYLNRAASTLRNVYGDTPLNANQVASILDTYYQSPIAVSRGSRFHKAVMAGDKNAVNYLGVKGYDKRNNIRKSVYAGGNYNLPKVNTQQVAVPDALRVAKPTMNIPVENEEFKSLPIPDFTIKRSNIDFNVIPSQKSIIPTFNKSSVDINTLSNYIQRPQSPIISTIPSVESIIESYNMGDLNSYADGGSLTTAGIGQMGNMMGNINGWLGQAGALATTIGTWGKENPMLGRNSGGGSYGMAGQLGMGTYDIMNAIRGFTKHNRPSLEEKIGLYGNGGNLHSLFAGGGNMMNYANIANSALKLASNFKNQSTLQSTTAIENKIDNFSHSIDEAVGNVNTTSDVLNLFNNKTNINGNLNYRDIRDKSYFDDFLSSVPASFEGFNAGSSFGPWGAAIGGIVGGVSSVVGSLIGIGKAKRKARELNDKINAANERVNHNLLYAADKVDDLNDYRALQNYNAMGGKLRFDTYNPSLTSVYARGGKLSENGSLTAINEGGRHEANPHGGVPVGTDNEGNPNLVEQGETIWKGDYVFSDRLTIPDELAEKYKLPKGITYAEASKKLSKEAKERPNDSISQKTMHSNLAEFEDTQEAQKAAIEQKEYEKEQDKAIKDQEKLQQLYNAFNSEAEEDNTYAFGGNLYPDGGDITNESIGDISPIEMGKRIELYKYYNDIMKDSSPIGWGFKYDKTGHAYDYTDDYKNLVNSLTADYIRKWTKQHPNDPSFLSYLKRGNTLDTLTDEQWRQGALDGKYGFMHHVANEILKEKNFNKNLDILSGSKPKEDKGYLNPLVNKLPNNVGNNIPTKSTPKAKYLSTWMRYAPMMGSFAMALDNILSKPDYGNANAIIDAAYNAGKPVSIPVSVIGDYRQKKPFDERYLTNQIMQNNAAANRITQDITNGNRAMGLAAIMANNYNNERSLAEAARQSYLANRADDAQVSEFNRGTNMFNAQSDNQRNLTEAQLNANQKSFMMNGLARGYAMRQALDDQRKAAISANITNALQGLGDMGWENMQRNWLTSLAERGVLAGDMEHNMWKDGAGITKPLNIPSTASTPLNGSKKSLGGSLKKKRRF